MSEDNVKSNKCLCLIVDKQSEQFLREGGKILTFVGDSIDDIMKISSSYLDLMYPDEPNRFVCVVQDHPSLIKQ